MWEIKIEKYEECLVYKLLKLKKNFGVIPTHSQDQASNSVTFTFRQIHTHCVTKFAITFLKSCLFTKSKKTFESLEYTLPLYASKITTHTRKYFTKNCNRLET